MQWPSECAFNPSLQLCPAMTGSLQQNVDWMIAQEALFTASTSSNLLQADGISVLATGLCHCVGSVCDVGLFINIAKDSPEDNCKSMPSSICGGRYPVKVSSSLPLLVSAHLWPEMVSMVE